MYIKAVFRAGHVGSGKQHEMVRYLKVKNVTEVLEIAQKMPRVKKNSAALLKCERISKDEYLEGKRKEERDPYINAV